MKKGGNSGETDDDNDLWRQVTSGIKAYGPNRQQPRKAPPLKPRPQPRVLPLPAIAAPMGFANGFDASTENKMKRGKLPLEGRIDLHGMTQQEAYNALHRFLQFSIAQGRRTVLVITGKGGVQSGGVLKRMVPLWLEEPSLRKHIVGITPASPKDGGSGAFYLRLRKSQ